LIFRLSSTPTNVVGRSQDSLCTNRDVHLKWIGRGEKKTPDSSNGASGYGQRTNRPG
jgi:hypothetical protein